jgi:hypothetical protein
MYCLPFMRLEYDMHNIGLQEVILLLEAKFLLLTTVVQVSYYNSMTVSVIQVEPEFFFQAVQFC